MPQSNLHLINSHVDNHQVSEHHYNKQTHQAYKPELSLKEVNQSLENANAQQVVEWTRETFGEGLVMSTSFGIQAAVMLHLVTEVVPDIPVIWVDTGYLPAETYRFAEELTRTAQTQSQGLSVSFHPCENGSTVW